VDKCPRHPRYKGKGMPTHGCWDCFTIKAAVGFGRKPTPPPNKVMKDKKKYTRKQKHKGTP
jgi:hypothetical protein